MKPKPVNQKILQEYFESLADEESPPEDRAEQVLSSYAEVQYRMTGGGHCQVCHAHVRHVLPIHVRRADRTEVDFECLCQRCLQAEQATAELVQIRLGKAHWVLTEARKTKRE